jgi:GT2 family glycosyltransferase/protoporphyrinogen oxidase
MIVILGAGLAGLATAYFLKQRGKSVRVIERQAQHGGLARSFKWHGFWCDFAAHRFFTSDDKLRDLVKSLVPMHEHSRRSAIYFDGGWIGDPADIGQLLSRMTPLDRLATLRDYAFRPRNGPDDSFQDHVVGRYGRTLYKRFFRPYTERMFGIDGSEIAVEWARLKVRLASPFDKKRRATKTRFPAFQYPVNNGYGAIADALYARLGDDVITDSEVVALERGVDGSISEVVCKDRTSGETTRIASDHVVSTLPITVTSRLLGVPSNLEFQKVDAVYLWLKKPELTRNHWLYFMDQQSSINRLVEFKHMSDVNTDPDTTVICAEVTRDVAAPIESVIADLMRAKLITREDVLDSMVLKEMFSYPRYRKGYTDRVRSLLDQLAAAPNLHVIGRAAQFEHFEADDLIDAANELSLQIDAPVARPAAVSATPAVAIVVLTWNNFADTQECLNSLKSLTYPNYSVIVVDNGSSDNTPQRVRAQFPDVTVIENGANLGVPTGYNVGFRHALERGADAVFMLNNDTIVAHDMLDHLVQASKHDKAGILHPIVYYYADRDLVWSAGARQRAFPPAFVMERSILSDKNNLHKLQYAISCGLLITRAAFERAGLFDENYRFNWDDLDFARRVRRAGLHIYQVPEAKMWHKISRSTNPGSALFWEVHGESGAIFFKRGRNIIAGAAYLTYFGLREFLYKWRPQFALSYVKGIRRGLTRKLKDTPQASK